MKRMDSLVLDEKDMEAIDLFEDLGMPKNLAKSLMYICQVDECTSSDVEHGADLRQPEVSIAMQEMRRKGWIRKREKKKEGKGRPVHLYKMNKNLPDILKSFEQEKMKEVETIEKSLTNLRDLMNNHS